MHVREWIDSIGNRISEREAQQKRLALLGLADDISSSSPPSPFFIFLASLRAFFASAQWGSGIRSGGEVGWLYGQGWLIGYMQKKL